MQNLGIVLHEKLRRILDAFSSSFGVRILFYSPDGEILTAGRAKPTNCAYCTLIQERICGTDVCDQMDRSYRAAAAARREMVRYHCHAGLLEVIKAIHAGENLLGFVVLGQIRTSRHLPECVRALVQDGRARRRLATAFEKQPLTSRCRLEDLLVLFEALVDHIVSEQLVRPGGDCLLGAVEAFIRGNLHRPLELSEVARHVHRSSSTVSHLVKEHTGKSFRQTVIDMRLDRAEALMRLHPDRTVAEIAKAVGYEDPFHFSRLYRKHRRLCPTEFRAAIVTSPQELAGPDETCGATNGSRA